jgi:phage terminase large subunit GpA-like protein
VSRGEPWPAGFCHFPQYSKEYFEQLTAEHLVTRTVAGRRISRWEKIRDRNEALDCRIYARAAAGSLRLESWQPQRWQEIERTLSDPLAGPKAPPGAAIKTATPVPEFRPIRSRNDWLE